MKLIKTLLILVFFLPISNAYAYLDPGTGGLILQALIGVLAAIGAYITLYWRKLKNIINKIFKKKKNYKE